MAHTIVYQRVLPIKDGNLVATLVRSISNAADTVTLPRMNGTSGQVAQLRRPGDPSITVSQGSATSVTLTFAAEGVEILLVSNHKDPIPAPTGDGA